MICETCHMKPKSADQPALPTIILGTVMKALFSTEFVARKFRMLGEIADYHLWLGNVFGKVQISNRRQNVWLKMHRTLGTKEFIAVELGVAWGFLTWWWVTHFSTKLISWLGFDSFTGLPRDWRNLPAGTFDAKGTPPDIKDSRIEWFIGDVEETINHLQIEKDRNYPLVVFFDLDIYEPSLVAWNHLKVQLKVGDLLYFDEAFDQDERRLLNDVILPSGSFKFIGASHLSLALEILEIN